MSETSDNLVNDEDAAKYAGLINAFIPILSDADHESPIPWMYLDTGGNLTIGIGHLMLKHEKWTQASLRKAVVRISSYGFRSSNFFEIGFQLTSRSISGRIPGAYPGLSDTVFNRSLSGNSDASRIWENSQPGVWGYNSPPSESNIPSVSAVLDDANKIMKIPGPYNFKAPYYRKLNRFELTNDGMYALAFDDVLSKISLVKGRFAKFDDFPQPGKFALIDIAFQGMPKGSIKHPAEQALESALAKDPPDWKAAAKTVPELTATRYAGRSSNRTAWRIKQFSDAAVLESAMRSAAATVLGYFGNH